MALQVKRSCPACNSRIDVRIGYDGMDTEHGGLSWNIDVSLPSTPAKERDVLEIDGNKYQILKQHGVFNGYHLKPVS